MVDSGFSFTHVVPICEGEVIHSAVKRINVGGKLLTNHLKEVISYRQVMVMDETYVINQVGYMFVYCSCATWYLYMKGMELFVCLLLSNGQSFIHNAALFHWNEILVDSSPNNGSRDQFLMQGFLQFRFSGKRRRLLRRVRLSRRHERHAATR